MAADTIPYRAMPRGVIPHASVGTPGAMTAFQPVGREVAGLAGSPRTGGAVGGAQVRAPFTPLKPLGKPPGQRQKQQERPELPAEESSQETGRDPWTYRLRVDEPSFVGALQGHGGPLADSRRQR